MSHTVRLALLAILPISVIASPPLAISQPTTISTVAITGDNSNGFAADVTLEYPSAPLINNNGEIVITTTLQGPTVSLSTNSAVIRSDIDDLSNLYRIERESGQAADLPTGVRYASFGITDFKQGGFSFDSRLSGTGVSSFNGNDTALFRHTPTSGVQAIARKGDAVPGLGPNVQFGFFGESGIDRTGKVFYRTHFRGSDINSDNYEAIISSNGIQDASILARTGDWVPGLDPSASLDSFGSLRVNDDGLAAIFGTVRNSPNPEMNRGLFIGNARGQLQTIALQGAQVPSLTTGTTYSSIVWHSYSMNNNGTVSFFTDLQGTDTSPSNNQALITRRGNTYEVVARKGQQAPGYPSGIIFTSIYRNGVGLNNLDQSLFLAGVNTGFPFNASLYLHSPGETPELIVSEGMTVPGLTSTSTIVNLFESTRFQINDLGTVVFGAYTFEGYGVFARDSSSNLVLIACEGQTIDVSRDPLSPDLRTIQRVHPNFNLNDHDELVFALTFTDGTIGSFVTTIPSPVTLTAFVPLAFGCVRRRRNVQR